MYILRFVDKILLSYGDMCSDYVNCIVRHSSLDGFGMSILASVSSARSFLSPNTTTNSLNNAQISSSLSPANSTAAHKALPSTTLPNDGSNLTPDELFTKNTVAEVRAIQKRLRLVSFTSNIHLLVTKQVNGIGWMRMPSRRSSG